MNYYIDAIQAWKSSRSKIRLESKLGELSDEQLAEVLRKMLNRESYKVLRAFIEKEFGVTLKSDSSLSDFYKGVKHFVGPARRRSVLTGARSTGPLSKEEREQIKESNRALVQERANEVLQNPESTREDLAIFLNALLKFEQMQFDREKFAVATCELFLKWSKDQKAKAIAEAPISNAQKIAQLRQQYFADVDALEKSGAVVLPE
jgi:hypothetical protein